MCCFAQSVQSVANTRIFSRLSGTGSQYLIYQMEFKSPALNAMILPLPVALPASEENVRFVNFKEYTRIFNDLDRGFPPIATPSFSVLPPTRSIATNAEVLKVHEIGDFVASFVPSVNDFDRLDPQFVIPKESWEKIPGYDTYGFAVFQLKSLEGSIQPIAIEFPTRFPDQIFYPTVHIHDGEVHKTEHFDHMLYSQDVRWDQIVGEYQGPNSADPATQFVRSKQHAENYCPNGKSQGLIDPGLLIHRKKMSGMLKNRDVLIDLKTNRNLRLFNRGALGTSVIGASLSWLLWRRNKLMRSKNANEQNR